jgi:phosphate-selective porin OprO/OprP
MRRIAKSEDVGGHGSLGIGNRLVATCHFPMRLLKRLLFYSSCLLFHSTGLAQVPAADSYVASEYAAQLNALQEQIDQLRLQQSRLAQTGAITTQPAPSDSNGSVLEAAYFAEQPPSSMDATLPPDYPTARLTGFFQADAVWFNQDATNMAVVGDVQDGADFRRARLAAVGDVWDNVSYSLEMDFAFPGRPSFMDVWLDVQNAFGNNTLRVGQYRQPIGMEAMTSVKELTFLERALPFAFLPFRQIGVMAYGHRADENVTWAVSGFRFPTDPFGGNVGDAGGFGVATRVTGLLYEGDYGVLHIGGGYSGIDPANDLVQYRNQPEVFVGETGGAALVPPGVPSNVPPFVDTDLIPTQNVDIFNAELAASYGSLYAQSELVYAAVNQVGGPALAFSGAYAHAGYFLTGERRTYNRTAGVFGRVVPLCPVGKEGGPGAWEVAGRWSYIDLDDENILGGRLDDVTIGVNWYLNRFTKFQFNYIHAMLARPAGTDSDADIYAVRAQVDF